MSQGIFVGGNRPKSKKAIKEAFAINPQSVRLEATSLFGNEYDGPIVDAPQGSHNFVGPDPYKDRKFYGTITVKNGKVTIK